MKNRGKLVFALLIFAGALALSVSIVAPSLVSVQAGDNSAKTFSDRWTEATGLGITVPACGSSSASQPTCATNGTVTYTLTWDATPSSCVQGYNGIPIKENGVLMRNPTTSNGYFGCRGSYTVTGRAPNTTYDYVFGYPDITGTVHTPASCATAGTVVFAATLNGAPWTGSIVVNGSTPVDNPTNLSVTMGSYAGLPTGSYSYTYVSGGPAGAELTGSPTFSQTLSANGTITFTWSFVTSLSVTCSVSPSLIDSGGTAHWTATASGGYGSYAYSWADTKGNTAGTGGTASWDQSYITSPDLVNASVIVTSPGVKNGSASCGSVTVGSPPSNNASCGAITVPASVYAGKTFSAGVTMNNIGTTAWTPTTPNQYSLAPVTSAGVYDPNTFGWGGADVPYQVNQNQSVAWNYTATAPNTPGSYTMYWQMVQQGKALFGSICSQTVTVVSSPVALENNASCGAISVPSSVTAGKTFSVGVTMNNNGTKPWTTGSPHQLLPVTAPQTYDWNWNTAGFGWGGANVPYSPVNPNQSATWNYTATAPSAAGNYNMQWQMIEQNVGWFGSVCTKPVTVTAQPIVPTCTISASPNPVDWNTATTLNWSSTNADSCTATGSGWSGAKSILGTQQTGNFDTGPTTFGLSCSGSGGTASCSTTVNVKPVCTANPASGNVPLSTTFSARGGTGSYSWSMPGGSPSSGSGSSMATTYSAAGTKTATVTSGGLSNTCTATAGAAYALTVNSSGAANVGVTGSPSAYGGSTNYSRTGIGAGTSITLSAPAASGGNNFSSWSGCDSASGTNCTVTMNADKTATANYAAANTPTCSASPASLSINQATTLTGSNGTGAYSWNTGTGGSPVIGSGNPFNNVTYSSAGSKTITVTSGSQSGTCNATVYDPTLVINPFSVTLSPNDQATLIAWYDADGPSGPSGNVDVTTAATWASDNSQIASVGASTGVVTAKAVGTVTIRANYTDSFGNIKQATANITVQPVANFDYSLTNTGVISVAPGGSGNNTINLTLVSGSSQSVSLSVSGLPANATGHWGSATGSPAPPAGTNCLPTCNPQKSFYITTTSDVVPGTYTVTVTGASSGLQNKTTAFNLVVSSQQSGPAVTCAGSPASAAANQDVTWTATPSGFSGTPNYVWGGDAPLAGRTGGSPTVQYTTQGTKTGSVSAMSGLQNASSSCSNSVTINPPATLSVSLTTSPVSGRAPLTGVSLTATVSGTQSGATNYTFYCNRSDSGTNVTSGSIAQYNSSSENPKTASGVCSYNSSGTYTAKVIAVRGSLAAESRSTVQVTAALPTISMRVNNGPPPYLFSSPATYTLSWNATDSTTCTATGSWTGSKAVSSSQVFSNIGSGIYTYGLLCEGPGGSAYNSVLVQVSKFIEINP